MCADATDRGVHLGLLVHREVIEDDDIARAQRRHEDLLDVGEKRRVVERTIEDGCGGEPVDAQGGDDGVRLPMAARRVIPQPHTPRAPSVPAYEIRRDAGFIDEDVGARVACPATAVGRSRHQADAVRRRGPFF